MIRKLRVKLVCILMALLTVMLGVTFGLVLHFTQQSLEAESLRTLEALANNWQTASSPGLDDGTRVPYFALEINARGDIITTRGGYFDLSDREKLQKLIDIAVNSEDDIGEVPDYGLRFYRVVTRTSWRVVFADTSAETTTLHSLIRTLAIASAAALAVFFVISGAELELGVFTDWAIVCIGLVYILFRSAGKYIGAFASSKYMKCGPEICKYLGITLLPQAGVALGMCTTAMQLGEQGGLIRNITLFSVLIYEMVGPLLTRQALMAAGDIQPLSAEVCQRRPARVRSAKRSRA